MHPLVVPYELRSRLLILVLILVIALVAACRKESDIAVQPDTATGNAISAEPAATDAPPAVQLGQSDEVSPPFPIERVEADLSPCEGRLREPGLPIVRVVVDEEGRVRSAEPLNPTGSCVQTAFVEAVKQWRFRPAMRKGQPTTVEFNVSMSANP